MKIKDVFYYFQGNLRYWAYYNSPFLIRKHILEQIDFRIKVMNQECFNSGSCIKCGCKTTALQMCDKSCEGNCYPPMMNSWDWSLFLNGISYKDFKFSSKYFRRLGKPFVNNSLYYKGILLKEGFDYGVEK